MKNPKSYDEAMNLILEAMEQGVDITFDIDCLQIANEFGIDVYEVMYGDYMKTGASEEEVFMMAEDQGWY